MRACEGVTTSGTEQEPKSDRDLAFRSQIKNRWPGALYPHLTHSLGASYNTILFSDRTGSTDHPLFLPFETLRDFTGKSTLTCPRREATLLPTKAHLETAS